MSDSHVAYVRDALIERIVTRTNEESPFSMNVYAEASLRRVLAEELAALLVGTDPPVRTQKRAGYDPRSVLVAAKHLQIVVGFSAVTAWRKRRQGTFPAPVRISVGRVAWLRSDLEAWVAEQQTISLCGRTLVAEPSPEKAK